MTDMSYLTDAHRDWHTVNGRWGCPLDCAESDPSMYSEDELAEMSAPLVRCGNHRKGEPEHRATVAGVRECFARKAAPAPVLVLEPLPEYDPCTPGQEPCGAWNSCSHHSALYQRRWGRAENE